MNSSRQFANELSGCAARGCAHAAAPGRSHCTDHGPGYLVRPQSPRIVSTPDGLLPSSYDAPAPAITPTTRPADPPKDGTRPHRPCPKCDAESPATGAGYSLGSTFHCQGCELYFSGHESVAAELARRTEDV